MKTIYQYIYNIIIFIKSIMISLGNRIKIILKLLLPQYRVIVQRIEGEDLILITSLKATEGLSPLITDKDRLLRFVHKKSNSPFIQESNLSFQSVNTSIEYIGHKKEVK